MSIADRLRNIEQQDGEAEAADRPENRVESPKTMSDQFADVEAGLAAFAIASRERDYNVRENQRLSRELDKHVMETNELRSEIAALRRDRDFWRRQATIMEQSLIRLGSLIRDEMVRIREEAGPAPEQ